MCFDMRSCDFRSVALSSVALLAGIEFYQGQLLLGGVVGALASLVRHDTLENISSEAVPLALTALAKLTKEHPPTASELVQLQVLPRLLTILKHGVPAWSATAAQLLHAMLKSDSHVAQEVSKQVVWGQEGQLVPSSLELLELGAVHHHADTVVGALRLLEVLLRSGGAAADGVLEQQGMRLMVQVFTSTANDSRVAGAAAATLATALEVDPGAAEGLVAQGLVPAVMKELRC
ncbi:hypothetical protein HaLaN_02544 [Haematococcus lacustris]|uniref:Uncharacterized protein n=1 Tax=Haematococcus lacustris TaxID=44745 RepID=A0A699YBZ3_HAELA|nr:hypothetical protein HaLaN_02544 [Haematococcus lacustris]